MYSAMVYSLSEDIEYAEKAPGLPEDQSRTGKLSGKDAAEFWALVDVFAQPTLAAIERSHV